MASPPRNWTSGNKPTTLGIDLDPRLQNNQARVVQHQYVRAQLREINQFKGKRLVMETLEALAKRASKAGTPDMTLEKVKAEYANMTRRLQTADLTINFTASGFFSTPNNYPSYTQMYERAQGKKDGVQTFDTDGGLVRGVRMQGDALNPADTRMVSDDKATFGKNMKDIAGKFKPSFGGIGRVMAPGNAVATGTKDEFVTSNPHFNPKTKEVFAALNYGRKPHGSALIYGSSYMVLASKFKTNAIYFAGDTFFQNNMKVSADDQVSYDLLGCVYPRAHLSMQADLYKSCVLNGALPDAFSDSVEATLLLEAHLFEPVTFTGNIQEIYLSPKDKRKSTPYVGQEWQNIVTNARAFAMKHGASLILLPA